jgi:porphyrinogen peroxidase
LPSSAQYFRKFQIREKTMADIQPGILGPVPRLARYLNFSLKAGVVPRGALLRVKEIADGDQVVVGIGQPAVIALGKTIPGLRPFPTYFGAGLVLPSTSSALWCWLRGHDRGDLLHDSKRIVESVSTAFKLDGVIDAFSYGSGRDLTGYEDGTENPKGKKARDAAIAQGQGAGLDGSSYVAVQLWLHDFKAFDTMSSKDQDNAIGRRKSDNKELENAPVSAHVKRTAQESFEPEAFVVRRSMPWADGMRGGLNFVAFGKSFGAFQAQLKRMVGAEDGITDALFKFTLPIAGSYFWCPPMRAGKLDLQALGI